MTAAAFRSWRKSSRSSGGGNCVEVAEADVAAVIGVRDSKDPRGGTLVFSRRQWLAFVKCIRDGTIGPR